jgi:F-type H+-transporting ATPase subunit epsilon
MADSSTTGKLRCVVVTPETTILDQQADFIAAPLFDGEVGILPGKSPMVGRLGFGELRLKSGGTTQHYYVDGGFIQVQDNVVSVLTGKSIAADKLAIEVARQQLLDARSMRSTSPEETAIRDRMVSQARAQLRVAEKR